jgi:beta-galactosidase
MKRTAFAILLTLLLPVVSCRTSPKPDAPLSPPRLTRSFDSNWLFLKSDAPGAEQPGFADAAWRKLDVPHDWSIEGPFAATNKTGGAGAFLPSGVGGYRKHFSLPENLSSRRVFIEFDGVMANSDVWINGFNLGHRPYGYVGFQYEMTGHLHFGGADNVLAVRADTSAQPASRYYFGAGIYRHVRLVATDPVHIAHWGAFVTTPQVSASQATVHLQCAVTNQSASPREIFLVIDLLGPDGKSAARGESKSVNLAGGGFAQIDQDIVVKNPQRWDLDNPVLYHARVTLITLTASADPRTMIHPVSNGATIEAAKLDEEIIPFGIREAKFEAETGFWLNGKNIKIKGVCLHQDASAFGIAVPPAVWEQRLAALKLLGANAIRTAHNPPDPVFLDVCDRMGFLVMDEMFDCWTVAKNRYDYHLYFNDWSLPDTRDTVQRDRNHPSIILYSAGNEIHDTPNAALSEQILAGLVQVFHENDPSRSVTQALFRPNVSHDYDNGLADLLDVIGTNYRDNELLAAHQQKPARKIIGTENHHDRGAWLYVRDNAPYAGQFLWSGIDYLGESRSWPVTSAASGLLDRTGAPKPMAAERQSWWSDRPMVYIARRTAASAPSPTDPGYEPAQQDALRRPQVLLHDWTPNNSAPHQENVEIYCNCEEVELFLNGQSLGSQKIHPDATPRTWNVPFASGTLRAVAKNQGALVAEDQLDTAGPPARLQLAASSTNLAAGWEDVCRVAVTVVDANGHPVSTAHPLITFALSGPGVLAAVDSADHASHEPFQAVERRAFEGGCVAFLKAATPAGKIILTASAPGLAGASITVNAAAAPPP